MLNISNDEKVLHMAREGDYYVTHKTKCSPFHAFTLYNPRRNVQTEFGVLFREFGKGSKPTILRFLPVKLQARQGTFR